MRINELNIEKLGSRVLGIVPASFKGNHSYPKSTLNHYIDKSDPETEFLNDLLTLTTPELTEKWYGGENEMRNLLLRNSPLKRN